MEASHLRQRVSQMAQRGIHLARLYGEEGQRERAGGGGYGANLLIQRVDRHVRLLGYCFRFGGTARGQDGLVYGTNRLRELRGAYERVLGGWMQRGGKRKRREGE